MTHTHLATIIAAQMTARLPVFLDPLMYARKGLRIEGVLRVIDFERLSDRLAATDGEIAVELAFDIKDGQACIEGHIDGQLKLTCERCMEIMTLDIDNDIHLGLVRTEQEIDGLLSGFEPLMASDEPIRVLDLIEDEILLLLPMVPSHAQEECAYIERIEQADESVVIVKENEQKTVNPFSTLSTLKKH